MATDGLIAASSCLRTTVAKSAPQPKHLKLYTEQPPKPVRPEIEAVGCMPELLRAFQAATRWTLRYLPASETDASRSPSGSAPVCVSPKTAAGFLALEQLEEVEETVEGGKRKADETRSVPAHTAKSRRPTPEPLSPLPSARSAASPAADRETARKLAGSIAELLSELLQTRSARFWQREAELAAGVPVVPHREDEKHLAARLEAVLKAGAEAVGGDGRGTLSSR